MAAAGFGERELGGGVRSTQRGGRLLSASQGNRKGDEFSRAEGYQGWQPPCRGAWPPPAPAWGSSGCRRTRVAARQVPSGGHRAGARSTRVTPWHGKLRAGRQEILVLHPKSSPKQRNGLPGQTAEILTAAFKKKPRGETIARSKGAREGTRELMRGGEIAGVFCPLARWWQQGRAPSEGWDSGRFPAETAVSLLLLPVRERLGLSGGSRAAAGVAAAAPVVSALASFREETLLVALILLCGV